MSVKRTAQTALVAGVITIALASAALASAARTFVSGSGSDGNTGANCPQGTPCRSFSAAYSVTSSGGEIIALDSAGYGEVTITGPVSIVGALIASVQVSASTTGITINTANSTDTVILENLQINGGNAANSTGITLTKGRLILQDSTVKLLTVGLDITGKADIVNTKIVGNGTGILTQGQGVNSQNNTGTNSGLTEVRLSGGSVLDNTTAWTMNNPLLTAGQTFNNVTIWVNSANTPNVAGNGTLSTVTGTGSSCTGGNNCQAGAQYVLSISGSGANFQ